MWPDDVLAKKFVPAGRRGDRRAGGVVNGGAPDVYDDEAFALLYHQHKLDLWRAASFWLHDRDDAEDVVQETFLRALRSLEAGTAPAAMRPWLLTICRNACWDRLRSRRRRGDVLSLDAPDAAEPAAGGGAGDDPARRVELRLALAGLRREEQEAFLLVDVLGLHSDEAAGVLGLRAPSTLRSRLARAREQIAPALVSGGAVPGGAAPPPEALQLWGLLHAPPEQALVVSVAEPARAGDSLLGRVAARVRAQRPAGGGAGLVAFFERLDREIPPASSIVAVVEDPAGAQAGRWVASHPRWELQHAATHDRWLADVEELLARCPARAEHDRERMLALLDGPTPFVWMYGR